MTDDKWGKAFTPEELAKVGTGRLSTNEPNMQNLPGTPAHALEWAMERGMRLAPAANVLLQTANSQAMIDAATDKLKADGYTQTGPDEWQKINPAKDSPETAAQMAALFAAKGTPDQQRQALDWVNAASTEIAWDETTPVVIIDSLTAVADHWQEIRNDRPPAEPIVTPVNSVGSYYAPDGTLMNADGTRSIFDDVDAGPWTDEDGNEWATAEMQGLPEPWPAHPDQTSPMTIDREHFEVDATGFAPLTPEHYDHPECTVAPVETIDEGDGPFYVVYFGKINYCVLAGQYATKDEAQAAVPAVWERFAADKSFDFIFPQRNPAGMEARTVRSVYNLKGAYGKL